MDRKQIEQLLVQQGVRAGHLSPVSRLWHDLGLEGDDAMEFFSVLAARFGTDLTILENDWDTYFGPDGLSIGPAAFMAVCAAIIGTAAMLAGLTALGAIAISTMMVCVAVWLRGGKGGAEAR